MSQLKVLVSFALILLLSTQCNGATTVKPTTPTTETTGTTEATTVAIPETTPKIDAAITAKLLGFELKLDKFELTLEKLTRRLERNHEVQRMKRIMRKLDHSIIESRRNCKSAKMKDRRTVKLPKLKPKKGRKSRFPKPKTTLKVKPVKKFNGWFSP